jgi:hypothetical protein
MVFPAGPGILVPRLHCLTSFAPYVEALCLGNSYVDGAVDHDSIKVGRSDGFFRAIRLRISSGAINFDRVVVRYGNGTREEIPIRSRIPDGGRTRAIDLPGVRRMIQSVDLWYGKDHWSKRPRVSLYGMR